MEFKIEKLKITGGSGRKPVRFRFEHEGEKYDYEFDTFEGHLQGNGFMGTRTRAAKLVRVRNGSRSWGDIEVYSLKSKYDQSYAESIARWLIEQRKEYKKDNDSI